MMVRPPDPTALPLDPGNYAGTYKLIGGRLACDFVNTISYPASPAPHDWLGPAANVITWSLAVDLIDEAAGKRLTQRIRARRAETRTALARLRRQREIIRAVLSPLAEGTVPTPAAIAALNRRLVAATGHRRIDATTLAWAWDTPERIDEIAHPIVLDAARILTDADHSRIGRCPACDWLFYDGSRNRSRRWCVMADCGSRDKAKRYYHRQRGKPPPSNRRRRGRSGDTT